MYISVAYQAFAMVVIF